MSRHIVLLGDSIFDNGAYTGREPDVVSHLRSVLPGGWRASLCAVDGSTTRNLPSQLERIPPQASHLVVSIGGNDALRHSDLLALPVRSTAEALALFGERVEEFETDKAPGACPEKLLPKKPLRLIPLSGSDANFGRGAVDASFRNERS